LKNYAVTEINASEEFTLTLGKKKPR